MATRTNLLAAWCVHLYTATGAVVGWLSAVAVVDGRFREAFLWMVAATMIDATDGLFARAARVGERLPRVDGGRLDDIVDYVTFVFVPALLVFEAGLLPAGATAIVVVAAMLLSSAHGFAAADAKTDDHYFTGFPSYWNIVVLYLYCAALPAAVNAAILIALSVLVFVRIRYVYPSRTPTLRRVTLAFAVVWSLLVMALILALPVVSPTLFYASLAFPVYYLILSLVLHSRAGAHR